MGAGPEGAETVAVQVCVALGQEGCVKMWPLAQLATPCLRPVPAPPRVGGPPSETTSLHLVGTRLVGRLGLPQFGEGAVMGRGGAHAYRKAVVGEKVRDRVAPFGGVGGQGRTAEEAGETGGCGDGLGSHIQALDFQPREPPEAIGNLG